MSYKTINLLFCIVLNDLFCHVDLFYSVVNSIILYTLLYCISISQVWRILRSKFTDRKTDRQTDRETDKFIGISVKFATSLLALLAGG